MKLSVIPSALAAIFALHFASVAVAQDPIHEGFENYTLGPLDGQGHWRVNDDGASNVSATTGPTDSITQVVEFTPNADSACAFLDATTEPIDGGKWLVTISVLVEPGFDGESTLSLANHIDVVPIEWLLHLRLNGNDGLLYCECGGSTVGVPLVVGEWNTLRIVVTLPTTMFGDVQVSVFYADQLVTSFFTPPILNARIDGIRFTTEPNPDPNDRIFFDNLEVIPFDPTIPGMPRCFGDGTVAPCPCGNEVGADDDEGCANSTAAGAALSAGGSDSIANGALVLICRQAVPNQPGVFLQGEESLAGGFGLIFGDGLRCCGTNVVRIATVVPDATGLVVITVNGAALGAMPGDFRCYQFWYRDPPGPCGSGFNLSNGYEVYWRP